MTFRIFWAVVVVLAFMGLGPVELPQSLSLAFFAVAFIATFAACLWIVVRPIVSESEQNQLKKWHARLASSMALGVVVVFTPWVLMLILSGLATAPCWAFGGRWCAP